MIRSVLIPFLFACIFCISGLGWLNAQVNPWAIETISKSDGLASQHVMTMMQDSKGFIWIGTFDGLQRYDGHHFKTYRNIPGDSLSLPDNTINCIVEAKDGHFWIGTNGGFCRFNPLTERFQNFKCGVSGPQTGLPGCVCHSIYEDADGFIWLTSYGGGISRLDPGTGAFVNLSPEPNSKAPLPQFVFSSRNIADPSNREGFWVNLHYGKGWQFSWINTKTLSIKPFPTEKPLANTYLWSGLKDRAGNSWICTQNGPKLLNVDNGEISDVNLAGKQINVPTMFAYEDRQGRFWFGTTKNGLFVFDPQKQEIKQYFKDSPQEDFRIKSNTINQILEDRSGVIWLSTLESGIIRFVPDVRKFQPIRLKTDFSYKNYIEGICEDRNGTVWLASEGSGVLQYDRNKASLVAYKAPEPYTKIFDEESFTSCFADNENRLWFGSNGRGLFVLSADRKSMQHFVHHDADSNSITANNINFILQDKKDQIWLSAYEGIDRYDAVNQGFIHYSFEKKAENIRRGFNAYEAYLDHSGHLWVATSTSLLLYDEKKDVFWPISDQWPAVNGAKVETIFAILQSKDGFFWFGSDNGFFRVQFDDPAHPERGKPRLVHYDERCGLSAKKINGLLEDDQGRIWASSMNGLWLLTNPRHDAQTPPIFIQYSEKNGLQSFEFIYGTAFKSDKGELFFGGVNGMNAFYPNTIKNNPNAPQMAITAFNVFDLDAPDEGPREITGISEYRELTLSYKNNVFDIQFAALDFREPDKNRYMYQLEGFQDQWIIIGEKNELRFTNLDPGTYTFRVKGSNNEGIWSEKAAELRIIILPPWWKSWWAYLTYLALILGGIVGFIRLRTRYLQQQNRELELAVHTATGQIRDQNRQLALQAESLRAMDELKSQFFANVSHELRTPLTLILGPISAVLKRKKMEKEDEELLQMAQKSGQGLLGLIGEILNLGKLEAGKLKLEETTVRIHDRFMRMAASFDSHAKRLGISYTYACALPDDLMLLLDGKKLETVFNNLMSNACKFTLPGGSIKVQLSQSHDSHQEPVLILQVSDTGRGIHPDDLPHVFDRYYQASRNASGKRSSEGGTGIGLTLCHEYAQLFKGKIWAESSLGNGSDFYFQFPLKITTAALAPDDSPHELPDEQATQQGAVLGKALEDNAQKPHILVVEDNVYLQRFLSSILNKQYKISTAANGVEALEWLEMQDDVLPDLVLSDIMMPVMDGFQLLESLKNHPRYRQLPVVMLTALADPEDKLRALRIGVDDYLLKPFEEDELMARLSNLLRNASTRNQTDTRDKTEGKEAKTLRVNEDDLAWLEALEQLIKKELPNFNLSADMVAVKLNMSRPTLFRHIKQLTGLTVQQYILEARLYAAREGLERGRYNSVKNAALSVGMKDSENFTRLFKERFGKLPSAYL